MTSNAIDRASIPMVPSLMLSATVLHPLSPVPKTGFRSEPNQEVLYSCLMTAQRINGNCLSRSTKIFLIFRSTRLLVTLFFAALYFSPPTLPFYAAIPSLSSSCRFLPFPPRLFSSCYLSLSTRPPTLSLLPNKTPKCSAAAYWRHSPIELLHVR